MAEGSASKSGDKTNYTGTATGPKGQSVSATGSVQNNGNGTVTQQHSTTGPNGNSRTTTRTVSKPHK